MSVINTEIPVGMGETLLALTMAELAEEVVRIRRALEALLVDPGNPHSAAQSARDILAEPDTDRWIR